MTCSTRCGLPALRIKDEVERRIHIANLGFSDLSGIHRTDEVSTSEHQSTFTVCVQQPALEAVERQAGATGSLDAVPESRNEHLLRPESAISADLSDRR